MGEVCQRCCFVKLKKQRKLCASKKPIPEWLATKPSFMRGAWGLGCIYCAAGRQSPSVQEIRRKHIDTNKFAGRCKQAISRHCSFCRCECRGFTNCTMLMKRVENHAFSDMHRLCSRVMDSGQCNLDYLPDPRRANDLSDARAIDVPLVAHGGKQKQNHVRQPPTIRGDSEAKFYFERNISATSLVNDVTQSKVGSGDDPFRGKVPQCRDWRIVWADYTSMMSARKQISVAKKKLQV